MTAVRERASSDAGPGVVVEGVVVSAIIVSTIIVSGVLVVIIISHPVPFAAVAIAQPRPVNPVRQPAAPSANALTRTTPHRPDA